MFTYLEEKGVEHTMSEPLRRPQAYNALYTFGVHVSRHKMMKEVIDPGLRQIAKCYRFQMRIRRENHNLEYSVTYRKPIPF